MRTLAVVAVWAAIWTSAPALYGASAEVVRVESRKVVLNAGSSRGVAVGMQADVYRQAEPIIHPVTGENLGSPRVKIARVEIQKVEPETSEGMYLVRYAPVQPGDSAEGLEVVPTEQEKVQAEVAQARAEITQLARSLADEIKMNQKAIADLQSTLRRISSSEKRLRLLINAVQNMREQMVMVEGRVVSLEEKQQAMIARDTAEVQPLSASNIRELGVLQRGSGESVYLQVGSQVYEVDFKAGKLVEASPVQTAAAGGTGMGVPEPDAAPKGLFEEEMEEEEEEPWYMRYWWVALAVGLAGMLGVLLLKMFQRQPPKRASAVADDDDGFPEIGDDDALIPDDMPELEEVEEQ